MIGDYGWKYSKLLGPPKGSPNLFEDQMRPFRERVAALQEGFKLREQGHKAELSRLAALTDPWPGKERLMFAEEWCSSYRSTNSGDRYAKVRAEIQAEELTSYLGLKAEVEAVRRASNLPAAGEWVPLPVDAYRVFVMVHSALDLELAKRSPRGMPFAEVVRLAWAKGANPRVYWPMLPHGYEEKNGFDHFGRKLVKGG